MATILKKIVLITLSINLATPTFATIQASQISQKNDGATVVDKRSGLSPLALAGCCIGGAAALYGIGTLMGKDMRPSWQEAAAVGIGFMAKELLIGYAQKKHPFNCILSLNQLNLSTFEKSESSTIDGDISNEQTNKFLGSVGIKPEETLIIKDNSNSSYAVEGIIFDGNKQCKIPTIGLIPEDLNNLNSSDKQQKNRGAFVLGHEAVHLREGHIEKQRILELLLPIIGYLGTKTICSDRNKTDIPLASTTNFLINLLLQKAYLRSCEKEADTEAVLTTGTAQGGIDFMTTELKKREGNFWLSWIERLLWPLMRVSYSHPMYADRIRYLTPIANMQAEGKSEAEIREALRPWWQFWGKSSGAVETASAQQQTQKTVQSPNVTAFESALCFARSLHNPSPTTQWHTASSFSCTRLHQGMTTMHNKVRGFLSESLTKPSTLTDTDVMSMGI